MKLINEKSTKFLGKYVDPTSKLDLRLSSKKILSEIEEAFIKRGNDRFVTPSKAWKENVLSGEESKGISEQISSCLSNSKVNGACIVQPPKVGDIVTLSDNLRLYIIAAGPKSIKSGSYTFINARGEIVFGKSGMIRDRVPGAIPQRFHDYLGNCVSLEQKFDGVAPVGMAESLTRSAPETIKTKDEKMNDLEEPEVNDPTDFVVSQATSQLLVDTDINTYIVPLLARSTYAGALSQLCIDSFKKVSSINQKLERLHRTLQYDADGNLNVPRTLTIFEILYHLEQNPKNSIQSKQNGNSKLGVSLDFSQNYEDYDYSASTYLATLFALRKQSRLWNLEATSQNECQTRVTVLPVSDVSYIDRVMKYLKEGGIDEFSKYCAGILSGEKPTKQPPLYIDIIGMLKDFVNRKFDHDPAVETVLVYVLRGIEKHMLPSNLVFETSNYVNEYSRTRAYDLLVELEKNDSIVNPFKWSKTSSWPNEKTSYVSDLSQSYYDCLDDNATTSSENTGLDQLDQQQLSNLNEPIDSTQMGYSNDFFDSDPMNDIREDLTNVSVYCIDSEFAHEIDDGISIHEDEGKYVISVHIAEPSSYVKPDSTLSSIAFNRTSTQYFPETALLMFPPIISNLSGLGIDSQDTRAFSIQYKLDKGLLDEFFKQRLTDPESSIDSTLLNTVKSQIEQTKEIKYSLLRNFRQGFTYKKVAKVLRSENRQELYRTDQDYNNLFKLFQLSTILNGIRSQNIPVEMTQNNSNLQVLETGDDIASESRYIEKGEGHEIRVKNSRQSIIIPKELDIEDSVSLVTENMIFANYLTGAIAKEKNIKILYRTFEFNISDELKKQFQELRSGNSIRKDEFDFGSFVSLAKYTVSHGTHALVGLGSYTTITSPMRRYVDMINQWKFQDYFLGREEGFIKDSNLENIANIVNSKAAYAKKPSAYAQKFWTGIFLREYKRLFEAGEIKNPIEFSLVLKAAPRKDAVIGVTCEKFPNMIANLEVSDALMEDYKNGLIGKDGRISSNRLQIARIDYVEDDLLFKYV
ncbi:uncharacterized protein SPAPADRAFT_136800 [Spathaspora passalidarum NRRL Y-27907]|uniref:RNB domain-containing protein n=1 Tax=Spathaspora passalidarum (strain NRRL Y-27907 / 11-Y1) TaxID=619300 RepID=G3AME3_SPAPN|nr:uncharacterized protein SPAPADRAFT_136800 [Spathaspora passalidarum NRRL Y-27907]EGW32795.1 hypothetical protein SPAPADRAFT_136800 [Spathaspora passalidarum NRRL Y-27907]